MQIDSRDSVGSVGVRASLEYDITSSEYLRSIAVATLSPFFIACTVLICSFLSNRAQRSVPLTLRLSKEDRKGDTADVRPRKLDQGWFRASHAFVVYLCAGQCAKVPQCWLHRSEAVRVDRDGHSYDASVSRPRQIRMLALNSYPVPPLYSRPKATKSRFPAAALIFDDVFRCCMSI